MTIEQILEQAASRGLLLVNLFQFKPDRWRANFHDGKRGYQFGEAATARDALAKALANVPDGGVFG